MDLQCTISVVADPKWQFHVLICTPLALPFRDDVDQAALHAFLLVLVAVCPWDLRTSSKSCRHQCSHEFFSHVVIYPVAADMERGLVGQTKPTDSVVDIVSFYCGSFRAISATKLSALFWGYLFGILNLIDIWVVLRRHCETNAAEVIVKTEKHA